MNPLTWGNNEQPIVRAIRLCVMAGIVAAVSLAVQQLPGIDFPGEYDATIIAIGTPLLAGLEKFLRSLGSAT